MVSKSRITHIAEHDPLPEPRFDADGSTISVVEVSAIWNGMFVMIIGHGEVTIEASAHERKDKVTEYLMGEPRFERQYSWPPDVYVRWYERND